MGERMGKAPVYFTIAQVRFNPILTLDALIPAIQDRLRTVGFPDYQVGTVAVFNINMAATQPNQLPVSQMVQHGFGDVGRTTNFVLNQSSLSLHTTDYETFESFSSTFLKGLGIVHDVINLGYTEQVGIRFLDAVLPQHDESLSSYLAASVQGLSQAVEGEILHAFSETKVRNAGSTLTARTVIQSGAVGFPPDLQPMNLILAERFSHYKGLHAILDTDGSYGHREAFVIPRLEALLATLHSLVVGAFKSSVTLEALKRWK